MAAYNEALKSGKLEKVVNKLNKIEKNCNLCPHNCKINRNITLGKCRTGTKIPIADYMVHLGEESPIVGNGGTGAIFISNCNF